MKERKGGVVIATAALALVLGVSGAVDAAAGSFYDLPQQVLEADAPVVQVFEEPRFRDEEPSDFGGSWMTAKENAEQASAVAVGYLPEPGERTLEDILKEYEEKEAAAKAAAAAQAAASTYVPPASNFNAANIGTASLGSYSYYHSMNSDVIGWLRVPGTNINYPVLQNTQNNNYYLERAWDKSYSRLGCIWADARVRSGSNNTVIYGHNWSNVSASPHVGWGSDYMFAQLPAYHYTWFAKSYPYIHYSTPGSQQTYKVFAVMYADVNFDYINVNASGSTLQYIIDEAKRRSLHNFDVDVSSSDEILTLSTCTRAFGSSDRQRFVVVARALRPGESITEVGVTSNPNYKRPQLW